MKFKTKKIILTTIFIALITLFGVSALKYKTQVCKDIIVNIENYEDIRLLTPDDIKEYIYAKTSIPIVGYKCSEIDFEELESELLKNPFVEEAYFKRDKSGNVVINVRLRRPIVKVYARNKVFYIDRDGFLMPIRANFSPYVLVANGKIPAEINVILDKSLNIKELVDTNNSVVYQIYLIAKYIDANDFWKSYISQIYYNGESIELIPLVGNFRIIFGQNAEEIDKKFRNLWAFLHNMPKIGWNKYKVLNLSYSNQIIAVKK